MKVTKAAQGLEMKILKIMRRIELLRQEADKSGPLKRRLRFRPKDYTLYLSKLSQAHQSLHMAVGLLVDADHPKPKAKANPQKELPF